MMQESRTHRATHMALDMLSMGVAIVTAELRIHFVNETGRRQLEDPEFGLFIVHSPMGAHLAARPRQQAVTLRRLVEAAVVHEDIGSMRVRDSNLTSCAVLISPTQNDNAFAGQDQANGKLAIVTFQSLRRTASPPAGMLCEIFDLSRAEAEVAIALAGGASAEDVARRRGVSLVTVRSQIRAILEKSDCGNLRDLERSMATLCALMPTGHSFAGQARYAA